MTVLRYHGKLVETLLQLEFPEHLVRGIAGMYQGLRYQVVTNGVVAEPFHVGIGVKQGCPLSPMLYRERERELRKEGREVPSRVRLREGPIGVRITLGQPTIG